jgi:hypothetical protein
MLTRAKERVADGSPMEDFVRGGPSYVACVCLRDNWEELDGEDRDWCIGRAIDDIAATCDDYELLNRVSKLSTDPTRPAAYVLPSVYAKVEGGPLSDSVGLAVARALTHPSEEVENYAAHGVGRYLAGARQDFVINAVGALAMKARRLGALVEEEYKKDYGHRRPTAALDAEIDPEIRQAIVGGDGVDPSEEIARLDVDTWSGRAAVKTILTILNYCPEHPLGQKAHRAVAQAIAGWWERERMERDHRRDRHFEFEHESMRQVAAFVLKLPADQALAVCEPFLAAVHDHEREVEPFVQGLILAEDAQRGASPFWIIWQDVADRVRSSTWAGRLSSRDADYSVPDLLRAVFLLSYWKEGVDHWSRLEGNAHRVDELFLGLPASAVTLEAYLRFLSSIGSRSLPEAFVRIARKLREGDAGEMLCRTNSVFVLESLLRRYVYSEPVKLKSVPKLRSAVLACLDSLVEAGSSAAYRMRDDFVTPLPSS